MPKQFQKCINAGGQVKTKAIPEGQYVKGCSINGKNWVWGEVKKKKITLKEAHKAGK